MARAGSREVYCREPRACSGRRRRSGRGNVEVIETLVGVGADIRDADGAAEMAQAIARLELAGLGQPTFARQNRW